MKDLDSVSRGTTSGFCPQLKGKKRSKQVFETFLDNLQLSVDPLLTISSMVLLILMSLIVIS